MGAMKRREHLAHSPSVGRTSAEYSSLPSLPVTGFSKALKLRTVVVKERLEILVTLEGMPDRERRAKEFNILLVEECLKDLR